MSIHDTVMSRKALLGGSVVTATALAFAPTAANATPVLTLSAISKLVSRGLGAALNAKAKLLGITTLFHGFEVDLSHAICEKHGWDADSIRDELVELILCRPATDHEEHPKPEGDHDFGGWGEFTSLIWGGLPALGSVFVHQNFTLRIVGSTIIGAYPSGHSWGSGFGWDHSSSWCTYLWGARGIRTWTRGGVSFDLDSIHVKGSQTCRSDWKVSDGTLVTT